MTKSFLFGSSAAAAIFLAATLTVSAQPAGNTKAGTPNDAPATMKNQADGPDKTFVLKAANSNMFEIESSEIAVKRAKDPEVKKFAQQMITDHTKAGKELKSVAGDMVPAEPDAATKARIEKINAAAEDKFDALYVDEQKAAHDEAVGLFTKASEAAEDPKLKSFAAETLPTLKEHQEHVKHLNAK